MDQESKHHAGLPWCIRGQLQPRGTWIPKGLQQLERATWESEVILSPGWDTIPWKEVSVSLLNGAPLGKMPADMGALCLLIYPPRKGPLPDCLPPVSSVSLNWEPPFHPTGQNPKL